MLCGVDFSTGNVMLESIIVFRVLKWVTERLRIVDIVCVYSNTVWGIPWRSSG